MFNGSTISVYSERLATCREQSLEIPYLIESVRLSVDNPDFPVYFLSDLSNNKWPDCSVLDMTQRRLRTKQKNSRF